MEYDLVNNAQNLDVKGQSVIISGWGLNENRTSARFLMKQYASVGATEKRVIELNHRAGHGACKGDSGGKNTSNKFTYQASIRKNYNTSSS